MSYGFCLELVPKSLLETIKHDCDTPDKAKAWVALNYCNGREDDVLGDCLGSWLYSAEGTGARSIWDLGICLTSKAQMLDDLVSMGEPTYDYGFDGILERIYDNPKEALLQIAKGYAECTVDWLKRTQSKMDREGFLWCYLMEGDFMVDFCRRRASKIEGFSTLKISTLSRGTFEDCILEVLWLANSIDAKKDSLLLYFYD